jgi:energy-coupling factor transporter ATP-binding protein EcfA2
MSTDLLGLGIKMFLAYRKLKVAQQQQVQCEQVGVTYQTVTDEASALLELKNKLGAVIVDMGSRGTGKTELAYRLAEFIGKPTYAISPEQKPHPNFISQINLEQLSLIPPGSTAILDDAPVYLSNRDYHEVLVQEIERMIPMVRHEKMLHLIIVTQSGSFIDKWCLDADAVFLKPQSILSADVERPGIKKIYQLANPYFEGKDTEWVRRHAYFMCPTYRGLIEFKMVNNS